MDDTRPGAATAPDPAPHVVAPDVTVAHPPGDLDAGTAPPPDDGSAADRRDEANTRLRLVLEHAADVIVQYSPDGRLLWASPSMRRELGWSAEDVVGRTLDLVHPDDRPLLTASLDRALATGEDTITGRVRVQRLDGGHTWMHSRTRLVRDDSGALAWLVSSLRDISEQVATERALAESERHYRMLAENATDVVLHTGADGLIAWASPSAEQILGIPPHELLGRRVMDLMHPDDVERTLSVIKETLAAGGTGGRTEARFTTADGTWRWMSMVGRALLDDEGRLVGGIDTLRDVESEHDAREELRRLATRDPLTGLPNRRQLLARLAVALGHAPDRRTRTGVMFIDLDHLRELNASYGHPGGDEILVELGQRLLATVGEGDVVSRFGGDEFVVLLTDVESPDHLALVAAEVHRALEPPIRTRGEPARVSVSIGTAVARADDNVYDLLQRADAGLLRAKRDGRARTDSGD